MSRFTRAASTDEQEEAIRDIEAWLAEAGEHIFDGTAIGKSPQTVILDLTHNGSEIYIDPDGAIRVGGELTLGCKEFLKRCELAVKGKGNLNA